MKHEHYLMSFHGLDVGLVYNLPKNVKVFLYCYPGKPIDATNCNEASTWYMATRSNYDNKGEYMKDLKLTIGDKKYEQFCVFSGNHGKHDLNRVPDLYLEDEQKDFRSGLFNLPVRFQRVFTKEKYSSIDKKLYKPGDKADIDVELLHKKLRPFTKKYTDLPEEGFLSYFVSPNSLYNKKFKDIDFIVVPKVKTYNSYIDLCKKANKKFEKTYGIPQKEIIKDKQPVKIKNKEIRYGNKYNYDISTPNSKDPKDIKKINEIVKNVPGLYLSDVIRILCNKHPESHITLTVSACRSFHSKLPISVQINQKKTSRMNVDEFFKSKI
tara:strand:+ start:1966 stop:2937 length:972 start_codon:yes stop_codon:yes gene_type:complete